MSNISKKDVAVIGISGRFPKSENIDELWVKLQNGENLTHFYSSEELLNLGISEDKLNNPSFIKMDSKIQSPENFDFEFFGYTFNEARSMDPQTRVFHEQIWSGLEDAGYDPFDYTGKIGVFAAGSDNITWRVYNHFNPESNVSLFFQRLVSDKNFMTLLASYKLNLKGPSYILDSACSSSLVAIHQAYRSLLLHECSIAIAGGIRVASTKNKGYVYEEGMIYSNDGYCRAFDAKSSGTIDGEGVGIVVLKRLAEAIEDGDQIYAVLKSSYINNDGNLKAGFTAPSVSGQIECIKAAHKLAGTEPETVTYIETHGTGTKIGDSIELLTFIAAVAGETKCDQAYQPSISGSKTTLGFKKYSCMRQLFAINIRNFKTDK